jgi:hypothetical protein
MRNGLRSFALAAGSVALCTGLLTVGLAQQPANQDEDVPSMTTDDLRDVPGAIVAPKTPATVEVATSRAAARGYVRVTTKSGYSFEHPTSWRAVDNLVPKGAPPFFTSDASFQDDRTGAAATAMSVDRSKSGTLDINDRATVDSLVTGLLGGGGDAKSAVQIRERQSGEFPDRKVSWVRVLADGQARAQGGGSVPASFVVQLQQSPTMLAIVAVTYPSSQLAVRNAALYTVSTLELPTASGPGDKAAPKTPAKNTAGGRPTGTGR